MKKVISIFIAFIFLSCMAVAQKPIPVKITCAPDKIRIDYLYADSLNNNLYVFYYYEESQISKFEIAKYDGKSWSVIAKINRVKGNLATQVKQICVVGKTLYVIGNFTQSEEGKELREYSKWSDGIFKYENSVWSVLPETGKTYDTPVHLINYKNELYIETMNGF